MRDGHAQAWPEFRKHACTPFGTNVDRSASSSRMFADLPPSSCATRFHGQRRVARHLDPGAGGAGERHHVHVRMGVIAAPTVGPSPSIKLKTPGGTPAASMISATMWALRGASSLGLSTIVQPAARAAATLQPIW
jgi:hypothetical protein